MFVEKRKQTKMEKTQYWKPPSTEQFITTVYPTVHTKRSYIRSKSNKEAVAILKAWSVFNKNTEDQTKSKVRRQGFGAGGYGDRFAALWEWPLGEPTIHSDEHEFEVRFRISPFTPDQVKAKVMGNELAVHCKTDSQSAPRREIFRCYQLPLNIDVATMQFTITDDKYLVVKALKDVPLKLALAYDVSDGQSDRSLIEEACDVDE